MSSSKKKETTKATTATTPTNPGWVTNSVQGMNNRIDALGQIDPYSLVAGASPLQQQAFSSGMNLGQQPTFSWLSGLGMGGNYATAPGAGPQVMPTSAGPSAGKSLTPTDPGAQVMPGSAGPTGAPPDVPGKSLTAPNTGPQVMPTSAGPGGAQPQPQAAGNQFGGGMGAYDLAGLLGFASATAGPNLATAQGYQAQGYNPTLATAANAGQGQGYNAAMIDPTQAGSMGRAELGPVGRASSRDFTSVNLDNYLNAGLNDLIDATRADYEASNGAALAKARAAAAWTGGMNNSNNAIRAATLEAELTRAMNSGLADTRFNAYNTAAGLAQSDLDRAAQTSMANAGFATQGALAQGNIDAQRYQQMAGQQFNALLANQGAANDAGRFGADANNQFALTNAGFNQQTNLANADAYNTAGRFGADAFNTANQWNAGAFNQAQQFNAGQADNANARLLQGAGILGDLGQTMAADNRANIQLQSDLGAQQREIERQYRAAPYDQAALLQQLYAMQPYNLFNGQTSNTNSTTSQSSSSIDFARLAMAGLGFAVGGPAGAAAGYGTSGISDPRMKENILPLPFNAPSGDALYAFNYRGSDPSQTFIGPMANEVAQTNPQAVGQTPQGIATVDYNALGIPSPQQQAAGGGNPLMQMARAYQQTPGSEEDQPWDLGTRQVAQQQQQANQQWIAGRGRRGSLFGGK